MPRFNTKTKLMWQIGRKSRYKKAEVGHKKPNIRYLLVYPPLKFSPFKDHQQNILVIRDAIIFSIYRFESKVSIKKLIQELLVSYIL